MINERFQEIKAYFNPEMALDPTADAFGLEMTAYAEQLMAERDIYREVLRQIASWCPSPHDPDKCRIAECKVARDALRRFE